MPFAAFANAKTDSLFEELKQEFNKRAIYDKQKEIQIQRLKATLKESSANRSRLRVAWRRLDALPACNAVGKTFHGGGWGPFSGGTPQ